MSLPLKVGDPSQFDKTCLVVQDLIQVKSTAERALLPIPSKVAPLCVGRHGRKLHEAFIKETYTPSLPKKLTSHVPFLKGPTFNKGNVTSINQPLEFFLGDISSVFFWGSEEALQTKRFVFGRKLASCLPKLTPNFKMCLFFFPIKIHFCCSTTESTQLNQTSIQLNPGIFKGNLELHHLAIGRKISTSRTSPPKKQNWMVATQIFFYVHPEPWRNDPI